MDRERKVELHVFAWDSAQGCAMRERLRQACAPYRPDGNVLDELLLAVGEAFSNAIRYGDGAPDRALRFEIHADPRQVRVVLNYPGKPFAVPDGELPDDYSVTGRGIYLMRKCTDHLEFRFADGRIEVTMVKRWPRPSVH